MVCYGLWAPLWRGGPGLLMQTRTYTTQDALNLFWRRSTVKSGGNAVKSGGDTVTGGGSAVTSGRATSQEWRHMGLCGVFFVA